MKVKDLIEELEICDPESEVRFSIMSYKGSSEGLDFKIKEENNGIVIIEHDSQEFEKVPPEWKLLSTETKNSLLGNWPIYERKNINPRVRLKLYLTKPSIEFGSDIKLNRVAFIKSVSLSGRIEGFFEDEEDNIWSCMEYELPLFFSVFPI
ncbi:MAG TPA: hypothetical protein PL124_05455 [Candidatus Cloacimonadota bacterium]|nr:hypothetical protein [Candidatus Cloacimonadota bacterium]HPS38843.1 hypothetical protein [Candidatus Cloacimonadota bacterium]